MLAAPNSTSIQTKHFTYKLKFVNSRLKKNPFILKSRHKLDSDYAADLKFLFNLLVQKKLNQEETWERFFAILSIIWKNNVTDKQHSVSSLP